MKANNEILFWKEKSHSYALPFAPETLRKTRRIIRLAERSGVNFKGRSLIDIGCGTGIYSLVLAAKACSVLGVDFSSEMLVLFRREARTHKIKNASQIQADWRKLTLRRLGGKRDIALASMTNATASAAGLRKMEACASEFCVYIGWAGVRENRFFEKIYAHHGIKYLPPKGAETVIPLLKKWGRRYIHVFLKDSWRWRGTPEAALKEVLIRLRANSAEPDIKWLKDFIKSKTVKNFVLHTTGVRKIMVVWRPCAAND